ncbi:MAG: hypothetical protein AB8G95_15745 [Anaerolineae bacterium]
MLTRLYFIIMWLMFFSLIFGCTAENNEDPPIWNGIKLGETKYADVIDSLGAPMSSSYTQLGWSNILTISYPSPSSMFRNEIIIDDACDCVVYVRNQLLGGSETDHSKLSDHLAIHGRPQLALGGGNYGSAGFLIYLEKGIALEAQISRPIEDAIVFAVHYFVPQSQNQFMTTWGSNLNSNIITIEEWEDLIPK